jgi:hypothetical protein
MWQNWLLAIVSALLPLILIFLVKSYQVLNRMWNVLKDYPPHMHVGDKVSYPPGMAPGNTQDLHASKAGA